jgi:hypothetical protein
MKLINYCKKKLRMLKILSIKKIENVISTTNEMEGPYNQMPITVPHSPICRNINFLIFYYSILSHLIQHI